MSQLVCRYALNDFRTNYLLFVYLQLFAMVGLGCTT